MKLDNFGFMAVPAVKKLVKVKMLVDLPLHIQVDLKNYWFKEGEVRELPKDVADLLVKTGKAVRL